MTDAGRAGFTLQRVHQICNGNGSAFKGYAWQYADNKTKGEQTP